MRVIWGPAANADLTSVIAYIEQFDTVAAINIAIRLRAATIILADYPRLGRPIGRGVHQLSTVYPYMIRYRVRRDHVEIISVRHGARR